MQYFSENNWTQPKMLCFSEVIGHPNELCENMIGCLRHVCIKCLSIFTFICRDDMYGYTFMYDKKTSMYDKKNCTWAGTPTFVFGRCFVLTTMGSYQGPGHTTAGRLSLNLYVAFVAFSSLASESPGQMD